MKKEYYKTLIDKYFDNTLTQSELKILIEWIKDDLNLAQWFEEGLNNSDNTIDAALCDKMFSKIRSEVFTENNIAETEIAAPTMKKKWSWMQWAAVFLIPLSVALFTTAVYLSQRSDISTLIVKAERGDKATITLPDGTCVILNSSSQLDYYSDYGSKERRVRLEGEGFFDVITDKDHTFVVQVSELEIKVLGTIFNVSAYHNDSEVDVVLLEGLVEVLTLDAKSILQPNERLTYNKETNKITTQKVSGIDYVTWTKGNLNEPTYYVQINA